MNKPQYCFTLFHLKFFGKNVTSKKDITLIMATSIRVMAKNEFSEHAVPTNVIFFNNREPNQTLRLKSKLSYSFSESTKVTVCSSHMS